MLNYPDAIWLNTNPSFRRFEQLLLHYLSFQTSIAQWEYVQHQDEPSSLEVALTLLHDYLKSCPHSVHLIGHSTGGLLGLLYARKYPEKVKSLTLLGVGVYPTIDWQVHYYAMRQLFPCNREIILAKIVHRLFGYQEPYQTKALIKILEQDLNTSPSPHSLYQQINIAPEGVPVPLMVCGSKDDLIVDSQSLQGWKVWLKDSDRLWECQQGHHFFHYFHSKLAGRKIIKFWQSLQIRETKKAEIFVAKT